MTAAAAALPPATPDDLRPPHAGLWTLAFAAVLALHLAVGAWLLARSPETGPTEAPEPIAMIDLPPAPVLPDAVAAQSLPPAEVVNTPPVETLTLGGALVPDIAPEAPEPVDAPVEVVERLPAETAELPAETAEPPPVPTVEPPDAAAIDSVPPAAVQPLAAAEAPPVDAPAVAVPDTATAVAAEVPLEAAPIVPDAAMALPAAVALPPQKPVDVAPLPAPTVAVREPPPAAKQPTPARQAEAKKPDVKKPAAPKAERTAEKTVEKPAAKKPAGPAANKPKAGGQLTTSAPRAAGGGPAADVLKQYQAKVRAEIEREVRRTPVNRTGVASIRFTFSRNGALSGAAVARSSGDPTIDRAALQAVKRASPFPTAPAELAQASFTLTVPIRMK